MLTVTDLPPEERIELVKTKLSQYHKTLTKSDVRHKRPPPLHTAVAVIAVHDLAVVRCVPVRAVSL